MDGALEEANVACDVTLVTAEPAPLALFGEVRAKPSRLWAIIGALSVGVLLLPAAVLALMAVLDARHDVPPGVARLALPIGAACALVVVAVALQLGSQ